MDPSGWSSVCVACGAPRERGVLCAACARGLVETRTLQLHRTAVPVPADLPLVERAIVAAARPDGTALDRLESAPTTALDAIERDLAEKGLLLRGSDQLLAQIAPAFLAALVPVVGFAKIVVGLQRGRPVLFLVVLTLATLVVAALFLRRVRRSRRGDALLRRLLDEHAALARQPLSAAPVGADLPAGAAAGALPLAVGLFGLTALAGTPYSALASELTMKRPQPPGDASSSGCSTVSGDSGGSSGGDSGGGGDGGSGCGGCGGGGD